MGKLFKGASAIFVKRLHELEVDQTIWEEVDRTSIEYYRQLTHSKSLKILGWSFNTTLHTAVPPKATDEVAYLLKVTRRF